MAATFTFKLALTGPTSSPQEFISSLRELIKDKHVEADDGKKTGWGFGTKGNPMHRVPVGDANPAGFVVLTTKDLNLVGTTFFPEGAVSAESLHGAHAMLASRFMYLIAEHFSVGTPVSVDVK